MKTEEKEFIMSSLTQLVTEDKYQVTFSFLPSKSQQVACAISGDLGSFEGKGENSLVAFLEAFRHYEVRRKNWKNYLNRMSKYLAKD